jgi:hypothetical protein
LIVAAAGSRNLPDHERWIVSKSRYQHVFPITGFTILGMLGCKLPPIFIEPLHLSSVISLQRNASAQPSPRLLISSAVAAICELRLRLSILGFFSDFVGPDLLLFCTLRRSFRFASASLDRVLTSVTLLRRSFRLQSTRVSPLYSATARTRIPTAIS